MSRRRFHRWGLWLALTALAAGLSAQDKPDVQFSGRIDTSLNVLSPDTSTAEAPWTVLGLAKGRVGLTAGSPAVKAEVRTSFNTAAAEPFSIDRAWVKFRFPGVRGTLGLGHLAWGPGLVFNAGDLLSNSTSLSVSLGADELRNQSAWLGDAWLALDDESFVEAMVISPPPAQLPVAGLIQAVPDSIGKLAGGMRLSLAPAGWLFELAYAVDGANALHKISLSSQFHAGLDWYASLRADLPFSATAGVPIERGLSASVGGFGLADLGEGFGLTTRHEALIRPWQNWTSLDLPAWTSQNAALSGAGGPGSAGAGLPYALYSYHELSLTMPEKLTASLRGLYSPIDASAVAIVRLDWAPLEALGLYLQAAFQLGSGNATWAWSRSGGFVASLGAVCTW